MRITVRVFVVVEESVVTRIVKQALTLTSWQSPHLKALSSSPLLSASHNWMTALIRFPINSNFQRYRQLILNTTTEGLCCVVKPVSFRVSAISFQIARRHYKGKS